MRITWCKGLEDVVNIARSQGWIFYYDYRGKHYFYIYAGAGDELMCVAVEVKEPPKAEYLSIDEEGKLVALDRPVMSAYARVTHIVKDETFEKILSGK